MAEFMVVLDATIVNVALPSIQQDLEMSDADLQWVVNAYTLVFGGFLLLGGRAGDLIGRKRVFLVGVAIFSAASLLNGLAPTSEALIVFRGVQGLGATLIAPAALSIITTTFEEGAERTKRWGYGPQSPSAVLLSGSSSAASSRPPSHGPGSSS
jgi:MFS family permease